MTDDPGGIPADQRCDYHGLNWKFGCVRCINAKAKYDAALPKLRDMWGKFPNLTRAPKDDPGGIQNIGADMADEIARLTRERDEARQRIEWIVAALRGDAIVVAGTADPLVREVYALRARVAELEIQVIGQLETMTPDEHYQAALARATAAEARVARLTEALRKYGEHTYDCAPYHNSTDVCTCGLYAALAEEGN